MTPTFAQAQQLPTGGSVAAGSATISAPNSSTLNINQSSDRAVINWNSFSIGQGGTVNFNQPSSSSATLNRVTGSTPSSIAGTINAPGTVLLVNPNGIAITKTGVVNVGSFAASALNIKDSDFMAGNYKFSGNGASAAVTNAGRINVSDGGFAALLGGQVANDGVISARLGRVGLGSGELITLDLSGDGFLSVAVPTSSLGGIVGSDGHPLVSNKGNILANGGMVYLSAATAAGLLRDAVYVPGSIRANSVGTSNGKIVIGGGAGGKVKIAGKLKANGGKTAKGGSISVSGAQVAVSGKVKANGTTGGSIKLAASDKVDVSGKVAATGKTGTGGVVIVTADQVTLGDTAKLDVSGATGGTLLIGGDYQGGHGATKFSIEPIQNAVTTTVAAGATLTANGTAGNGGNIVVWSDDKTIFAGAISATGAGTGKGGFAEVSGHRLLDFTGTANLTGPGGFGTLLLDPRNVTISSSATSGGALSGGTFTPSADDSILNVSTLTTALASGNVIVTTGSDGTQDGDITVASIISWSANTNLTLSAHRNIIINSGASPQQFGTGTFTLRADNTGTGTGTITFGSGVNISTNGTVLFYYNPTGDSGTVNGSKYTSGTQANLVVGGSGAANTKRYMLVNNVFDLQNMNNNLAGSYALGRDIDASATAAWNGGSGFAPIGTSSLYFDGSFNGQGRVISGLTINRPTTSGVGLFAFIQNGSISNVGLIGGGVTGDLNVGGLVGLLAASGAAASITQSFADVAVTGNGRVGGLVGQATTLNSGSLTITNSYAAGNVVLNGAGTFGGGLIGLATQGSGPLTVSQTYATGSVVGGSGSSKLGGLIGGSGAAVSFSYATGAVSGGSLVGGLLGNNNGLGVVSSSYWDVATTGQSGGYGSDTGSFTASGITSAQARTQSSYSGWDFANTWYMIDGSTRPFLQMEASTTIRNAHQLQLIGMNATTLAASYTLANDINLGSALSNASDMWGSAGWVPIGLGSSFNGSIDGQDHTISGLTIYRPNDTSGTGLFSVSGSGGGTWDFSNIVLDGGSVVGGGSTGALVGITDAVSGTYIRNVHSSVAVQSTGGAAGGLVGQYRRNGQQIFRNSSSSGNVIGVTYAGGLVGQAFGGWFENDYATGSVTATGVSSMAGGLVGAATGGDTIFSESYATGAVSGDTAGGLVGRANMSGETYAHIDKSYASGAVTGITSAGGLTGYLGSTAIYNSYATGTVSAATAGGLVGTLVAGPSWGSINGSWASGAVSGSTSAGGLVGQSSGAVSASYWDIGTTGQAAGYGINTGTFSATGLTTTQARTLSSYSGWDFTNAWYMVDGSTRPFLRMEASTTTITNAHQLQLINMNATTLAASYTLANDIDLGTPLSNASEMWGSAGWVPIGTFGTSFTGTFDGNGHTISGLTINRPSTQYVGLFGYVDTSAVVSNLGVAGTVTGQDIVGMLAGDVGGTVSNVYATGTLSGQYQVGGLAGILDPSGTISLSHANVAVTGAHDDIGGLVGQSAGAISQSYAGGSVVVPTSAGNFSGGLVGTMYGGSITQSFATGAVDGGGQVGGLVGTMSGGTITQAYATGPVNAKGARSGGLVGGYVGGTVSEVYATGSGSGGGSNLFGLVPSGTSLTSGYWDTQTSGLASNVYGTGTAQTTAQLQAALPSGFNSSVWGIVANKSYPYFLWQHPAASGTPQVISGTAYTGYFGAPAASGASGAVTVSALVNGTNVGSIATGANGYYNLLLAPGTITTNSQVAAYTTGATGGLAYQQDVAAGSLVGLNIFGTYLSETSAATTLSTVSAGLATAIGSTGVSTTFANRLIYSTGTSFQIDEAINLAGTLRLSTTGDLTQVSGASGAFNAGSLLIGRIGSGAPTVTLTNTGNVFASLGSAQLGAGILDLYDSVSLSVGGTAVGRLLIQSAGSLTVSNTITASASGDALVLVAGTNFINGVGSSVLSAPNGRWLVYSTNPGSNTFNNLNSGNTAVWNAAYAANAPATIASGNRYVFSFQPTATFTSLGASKTYGNTVSLSSNYSVSGINAGVANAYLADTIATAYSGTPTVTSAGTAATASVAGGPYAIDVAQGTVTGLNGYAISFVDAGVLTVNPANLTVTANAASKTYDGLAYSGGNGVAYSGLVNGETSSVLGGTLAYGGTSQGAVNAGSYTLTASGQTSGNYTISYVASTLTVGKANLTVTANAASKTYDGLAFFGGNGVSYAGFVNGETSSVLGGTLAYGGTAQGATNAGSYTLTASGLTASNYNIAYNAGALTIGKASLTVTATDASKTYDGLAFSGGNGVSYSGLVNGETSSVLGGTLAYGGTAQGATNAGSYTLTASGLTASNYNIAYSAGSLTVGKAALTVTATDAGKTYDGLAFSGGNGVTYSGLVNGETSSVLGGTLAYGGTAQGATNAGSYTLTASGLTASNYTIGYSAGSLTVGKAALTVTATDASKTYDGLAFNGGNGVTYSGLVNGETSSVLGGTLAYGGTAQGATNAGSYTLTASGLTASNYTIAYNAGALTVGKASLTVTATDASKTYDGLAFSGGNGVTYSGLVNGESSSVLGGTLAYGGTAQGATNAGSYTLTASGLTSGNYTISYVASTLTVGKAALTVTASDASKTYDGLAYSGGNGVSYAGFVNGETSSVLGGTLAYGGTAQGATNAGSYTLTASGLTASNYTIAYTAGSLTVGKAALTVTATDASKTYDGLAFNGGNGVTYSGLVNGETSSVLGGTLAYGGTAQGATNAGSYTLTASGLTASNYNIAYNAGALTVGKAALTVTATDASRTYDGLAFSGGNGVTYSGLVNGETASVLGGTLAYGGAAQGATNAGSYTLTASGLTASNYTIAYTAGALTVGKASLTVTATDASKTYDGLAFSGGNGVTYSGLVNGETSSVLGGTLAYGGAAQGATNAGSYTLTASGLTASNYTIAYTAGALTVGKASLTVTATDASKTYDGLAYSGGNGVTYSGLVNGETSSVLGGTLAYGGTAQGATNAGSYTLTASGLTASNYTIAYNAGSLTVGKAALTVAATDAAKTYDGLAFSGGNGVSYAGFVNGETSSVLGGTLAYGGTAQGATNAGSYALTASGLTAANYTIAYNAGALTVSKASLTVTASDASKTYDGLAFSGGNGVTYSGLVNGESSSVLGGTLAFGGTSQGAVNAGSYTLTASGQTSGNYTISYVASTLTVGKANLIVTATDASKTYDGLAFSGGNGVTYSGLVNGETSSVLGGTLSYGGTAQGATNAGSYTLTASGLTAANYIISYAAGALTVGKAALTVTANDLGKTYGNTLNFTGGEFSTLGLVGGDSVSSVTLASAGTVSNANVGQYAITASNAVGSGLSNYTISYANGTLNVTAALLLVVTANDATKTYGTALSLGSTAFSAQGLTNGDTITSVTLASAGAASNANVGQYAITASNAVGSGLSNYNISYVPGTLVVNPASLTVTAANATKTYDGLAYSGGNGVSYAGLVNGETSSVLGGTLTYGGMAQGATNAGSYTLTASGLTSSNYTISYVAGALAVNKAALTVTATDASKTYDGLAFSGGNGVTYGGLVNGETSSVLGGTLVYGGTAQGATNAGSYTLTASGLTASNYNIAYNAGALTVNKAALTVTASDASKTYDGLAYSGGNGVSYSGLVNGETSSVLGGTLSYGGTAQGATNAGSYTLTASGLTASNYNIAYNAGALTVGKASLTVTATDAAKTYDGLAFSGGNGVTYSGLVNGESSSVLGGTLVYGGTAQGATNAGSYTLTASGLSAANYNIAYNAGALTVGKASLTVTAIDASKTYDGLAYSGGNGVSYSGLVNGESSSVLGGTLAYGGAAQGATNAGSYTLTASGLTASNYNIAYNAGVLTVNKAALTVTAANDSKTYDGLAYSGGNGVSYSGLVNGETASVLGGALAYGGTAQGATNAGSYTLTASGLSAANYAIAYNAGSLTVGKAALTVTAANATKTYDGLAYSGGNGVAYSGLVNGETSSVLGGTLAYGGTAQGATNAGSYTLTASGLMAANYIIAYNAGSLTVGKAALTVTAANASKTYDGLAYSGGNGVTYSGLVNGETSSVIGGTLAYGGTAQGATNAGSYTLTASGLTAANYTINYAAGALTVGKAALTVTATDASKTYDGLTYSGGNGVTYSGLVNGETTSVLGGTLAYGGSAQGAKNAGSYTLTASGLTAANYTVGYTDGTLNIGKAAITAIVSANDKVYDGTVAGTGAVNGFNGVISGDTLNISGAATFSFIDKNVAAGKTVNVTGLSLGGASAGNYNLASTATAVASITPATLTVATDGTVAASKIYDGTTTVAVAGNGALAGVIGGDVVTLTLGSTTYADANVGAAKTVTGSYSLGGAASGNYQLASSGFAGTAAITAATLTIATNGSVAASKVYDGTTTATVTGNGTLAGVIGSDVVTLTLGSTNYSDANVGTAKTVAGSYGLGGASAGNYQLASSSFSGAADITVRPITVTADAQSKFTGAADPLFTYQMTSGTLAGADTLAGALTRTPGESVGVYGILQGTLAASANYSLTYIGANLSINDAPPSGGNGGDGGYATSQYEAPHGGSTSPVVNVSYQPGGNNTPPVINVVRGFPTGAANNTNSSGNTVAAVTTTPDASQNIEPGSGPTSLFWPISQFDKTQYSSADLPAYAAQTSQATVLAMIARAGNNNRQEPKIDQLWKDDTSGWANLNGAAGKSVKFGDGNGNARTPAGDNGFAIVGGTTDIAALLKRGPVMLSGSKAADVASPTPWLLALEMTAGGKGILANDPVTGQQVVLAYDPATKKIGGVTEIVDPKTKKLVAIGDTVPDLGAGANVPAAAWTLVKTFQPASYFAVTM